MFWSAKKVASVAAENTELRRQLENARLQITKLTLERIQLVNEIELLKEYRGVPPQIVSRPVGIGVDSGNVPVPANSQIGLLHAKAAS